MNKRDYFRLIPNKRKRKYWKQNKSRQQKRKMIKDASLKRREIGDELTGT